MTAHRIRTPFFALASAGILVAALAGCSAQAQADGDALTVTDPWVKATDTDMTGVFASMTTSGMPLTNRHRSSVLVEPRSYGS